MVDVLGGLPTFLDAVAAAALAPLAWWILLNGIEDVFVDVFGLHVFARRRMQLREKRQQMAPGRAQKRIAIVYDGVTYPDAFRADLVVEEAVVIEVKCVSQLAPVHHLQLLTYLRLAGYRLGILINFSEGHLKNGIRRIVNGL